MTGHIPDHTKENQLNKELMILFFKMVLEEISFELGFERANRW